MAFQDEIESLFRKLKPVLGSEIDSLWLAYHTQTDPRSRAEVLGILYSLASQYLDETFDKKVLLSLPTAEESGGDCEIGRVFCAGQEMHPFGLREHEWLRHIGIFGTTGSGKTNCAFILLSALRRMDKPFLVFDWKRNYRDLLALPEFGGLKVYTIGLSMGMKKCTSFENEKCTTHHGAIRRAWWTRFPLLPWDMTVC